MPGACEPAERVIADAADAYRRALGERLLAAYALGSLAHGGFSPLVSDIDVGLVLADPLREGDAAAVGRVAAAVRMGGSALHERLSVFWGTPSTLGGREAGGRFPPLDRLDLIEHGRLLAGADCRAAVARPQGTDLLTAGAEFALATLAPRAALDGILRPAALLGQGVRAVTKLVLFPARFIYSAETGEVGTNGAAAAHYAASGCPPGAELVAEALAWRAAPPEHAPALLLLQRDLGPLYLHYLDDHTARLAAAGRPDLAGAFAAWRERVAAAGR
jgi:hypothetical protein